MNPQSARSNGVCPYREGPDQIRNAWREGYQDAVDTVAVAFGAFIGSSGLVDHLDRMRQQMEDSYCEDVPQAGDRPR
jgi:hypothetical protein